MKNIFSKTLKEIKDSRRKGKKSILQEYYGKFLIYKWDINGKSYIGLTTNLKVRIKNYLSNIYSNHYICRTINKYDDNDIISASFNQAVIVNGNIATIVEVEDHRLLGEKIRIETKDGLVFDVFSGNVYPMSTENTDITPEDFARSLVGEEGEVNYLGSAQKTK